MQASFLDVPELAFETTPQREVSLWLISTRPAILLVVIHRLSAHAAKQFHGNPFISG
jgi:hypothetical protein